MTKINGVDMSIFENLAKEYQESPDKGIVDLSSTIKWTNGFQTQAYVGDHEPIVIDEPNWLGGTEKGPNPAELLLSALGSCVSVAFLLTANEKGIKIKSLEVNISGQLDLKVLVGLSKANPGFNEIDVHITVSSDEDDKTIEELVSQTMELSTVKNSLSRIVQVNPTFKRK